MKEYFKYILHKEEEGEFSCRDCGYTFVLNPIAVVKFYIHHGPEYKPFALCIACHKKWKETQEKTQ